MLARPAPRPRLLGARHASATADPAARLARRPLRLSGPAPAEREAARMKLLVAGGAGFIGSNYVRRRLETHPDDSVGCSTSSPTRGGARTSRASTGSSWSRATSATASRPRRDGGMRRDRQLRRRVARRPLDPLAGRVHHRPMSSAPSCCSRRPATPASAICRSPPTRSTARSSEGSFTETSPLAPPRPTRPRRPGAT